LIEVERLGGEWRGGFATLHVEQPSLGAGLELFILDFHRGDAAEPV
jgi:hypothetical protein